MLTPLAAQRNASFWQMRLPEFHRNDLARIGRRKGRAGLSRPRVAKYGHKQALSRQRALTGAGQLAHQSPALVLPAAVPEDGAHLDFLLYVAHGARFGQHALAGVQLDFHHLHVVPEDLVFDLVGRFYRRFLSGGAIETRSAFRAEFRPVRQLIAAVCAVHASSLRFNFSSEPAI